PRPRHPHRPQRRRNPRRRPHRVPGTGRHARLHAHAGYVRAARSRAAGRPRKTAAGRVRGRTDAVPGQRRRQHPRPGPVSRPRAPLPGACRRPLHRRRRAPESPPHGLERRHADPRPPALGSHRPGHAVLFRPQLLRRPRRPGAHGRHQPPRPAVLLRHCGRQYFCRTVPPRKERSPRAADVPQLHPLAALKPPGSRHSTLSAPTTTIMLLIPAIDLNDGQCVRLRQGDLDQATVFSEDPAAMADQWVAQGARRLHLVDLNGAVAGKPRNRAAIQAIVDTVDESIPVQIGGGIRDLDTVAYYLDNGISYVIIGTAAVKDPGFLSDACSAFPGHIIVGLDARDGKIATDGWSKLTRHDVLDLARKFEDYGCESIIYTDIGRDGMLSGVNIEATVRLAQHVRIPVIASGGVASLDDIRALCEVADEGVDGAILGRSLYEGTLDFAAAQSLADQLVP